MQRLRDLFKSSGDAKTQTNANAQQQQETDVELQQQTQPQNPAANDAKSARLYPYFFPSSMERGQVSATEEVGVT